MIVGVKPTSNDYLGDESHVGNWDSANFFGVIANNDRSDYGSMSLLLPKMQNRGRSTTSHESPLLFLSAMDVRTGGNV